LSFPDGFCLHVPVSLSASARPVGAPSPPRRKVGSCPFPSEPPSPVPCRQRRLNLFHRQDVASFFRPVTVSSFFRGCGFAARTLYASFPIGGGCFWWVGFFFCFWGVFFFVGFFGFPIHGTFTLKMGFSKDLLFLARYRFFHPPSQCSELFQSSYGLGWFTLSSQADLSEVQKVDRTPFTIFTTFPRILPISL